MFVFHAGGRGDRAFRQLSEDGVVDFDVSEDVEEVLGGDPAGPQDAGHPGAQGQDRGLDAHFAWPAVDHCGDLAVHVVQDMGRRRGRRHAGRVGGRRRQRGPGRFDDGARHRMGRHADGDRVEARGDFIGDELRLFEDDGERSGPEGLREVFEDRRHEGDQIVDLRKVRDVYDQRIVHRTALRLEDVRDGLPVQGICRETVHGLGRDGHQFTVFQQLPGFCDILYVSVEL